MKKRLIVKSDGAIIINRFIDEKVLYEKYIPETKKWRHKYCVLDENNNMIDGNINLSYITNECFKI